MLMSPNKDETAVHGCHCQGDMAVRMRKVLQTAGLVFECVTCFFRVSLFSQALRYISPRPHESVTPPSPSIKDLSPSVLRPCPPTIRPPFPFIGLSSPFPSIKPLSPFLSIELKPLPECLLYYAIVPPHSCIVEFHLRLKKMLSLTCRSVMVLLFL